MIVYGVNPVLEALRAGRVISVLVSARARARLSGVLQEAQARGVDVGVAEPPVLDRQARGGVHQGVVARIRERGPYSVADLVERAAAAPLLVVLDGVEDPHNVGAILRSADAAGADGVIRQTRRAARLDGAAAKASAGAAAHVRVADVVNIARAIEELNALGVWTVGLAGDGGERYDAVDWTLPSAVVVGAEGTGLRRLVRARCDRIVSIPMSGHVDSLNVSVATGVVLFEARRQRDLGPDPGPGA